MSSGAIEVKDDGTLVLTPQRAENPQGLEDALSLFADRASPSETPPRYRLSASSVWRARRMGLPLERIIEVLETHSGEQLPDKLHSELTLWSQQIERLWLEVDQGRLILRSANPLVITAVVRHRTLSDFVTEQLDATTVAVRVDAYPALIETFGARLTNPSCSKDEAESSALEAVAASEVGVVTVSSHHQSGSPV